MGRESLSGYPKGGKKVPVAADSEESKLFRAPSNNKLYTSVKWITIIATALVGGCRVVTPLMNEATGGGRVGSLSEGDFPETYASTIANFFDTDEVALEHRLALLDDVHNLKDCQSTKIPLELTRGKVEPMVNIIAHIQLGHKQKLLDLVSSNSAGLLPGQKRTVIAGIERDFDKLHSLMNASTDKYEALDSLENFMLRRTDGKQETIYLIGRFIGLGRGYYNATNGFWDKLGIRLEPPGPYWARVTGDACMHYNTGEVRQQKVIVVAEKLFPGNQTRRVIASRNEIRKQVAARNYSINNDRRRF